MHKTDPLFLLSPSAREPTEARGKFPFPTSTPPPSLPVPPPFPLFRKNMVPVPLPYHYYIEETVNTGSKVNTKQLLHNKYYNICIQKVKHIKKTSFTIIKLK